MTPAIFLDKDGTLIPDIPYNVDPERITLADGVKTGVKRLYEAGYALILISNQAGVARGYFPETALIAVWQKLQELLEVPLTDIYYCPHHPEGTVPNYAKTCTCRKPSPGLIQQAAIAHDIDLSRSWMIGDILNDVEAGHRAGCHSILINNGNETEWELTPLRSPDFCVNNFADAVEQILLAPQFEPIANCGSFRR